MISIAIIVPLVESLGSYFVVMAAQMHSTSNVAIHPSEKMPPNLMNLITASLA
jgi:hypothetical protein